MAHENATGPATAVPQQSHATGAISNSVSTGTNDSAITAEGNFGDTPATSDQDSASANSNPLVPSASDPVHMAKFKIAVLAALDNTDFTGDAKKVEKATVAVTLPNPEDRVRAQLQVHAKKTLYAKAAEDAERGLPFVLPTKADIDAYVEKGIQAWKAKQPQQ